MEHHSLENNCVWEQKPLLLSSVTSKTIWFPREEQTREQLLVFSTVHRHLRHAHVNYKIQYLCVCVLVAQSCPALCNPMDCSPPGSSIHGILQARILEWVAIPFSRGSSQPKDQTRVSCISCIGRQILYHWATWKSLLLFVTVITAIITFPT